MLDLGKWSTGRVPFIIHPPIYLWAISLRNDLSLQDSQPRVP